jgi:hypothetical protein
LLRVPFLASLLSCSGFVFVVDDGLFPADLFVLATLFENGRGHWKLLGFWSGIEVHLVFDVIAEKRIRIIDFGLNTEDSEERLGSHYVEVQEAHCSLYLVFDCSIIKCSKEC